MAVLDHDHLHLPENKPVTGSTIQFCLFWVGVFAFIGLLGALLKS